MDENERRDIGRIVDLRVVIEGGQPTRATMEAIELTLRSDDAVFSVEGSEIEAALASTSVELARAAVVPRVREAVQRAQIDCSFRLNGIPVSDDGTLAL